MSVSESAVSTDRPPAESMVLDWAMWTGDEGTLFGIEMSAP